MKNIILTLRYFLLPYILLLAFFGYILSEFPKPNIHLFFNSLHHPFFDFLFKYITHIGDGLFLIPVFIFLLFIKFRSAFSVLAAYLLSSIITQTLKNTIFEGEPRPLLYFKNFDESLRLIDGITMNNLNSFPSGHATSAFALFVCLAWIVKNKFWQSTFLILACFTAFSRVYISQHFLGDIYAGSIIGCASAIFIIYIFEKYTASDYSHFWNKNLKLNV